MEATVSSTFSAKCDEAITIISQDANNERIKIVNRFLKNMSDEVSAAVKWDNQKKVELLIKLTTLQTATKANEMYSYIIGDPVDHAINTIKASFPMGMIPAGADVTTMLKALTLIEEEQKHVQAVSKVPDEQFRKEATEKAATVLPEIVKSRKISSTTQRDAETNGFVGIPDTVKNELGFRDVFHPGTQELGFHLLPLDQAMDPRICMQKYSEVVLREANATLKKHNLPEGCYFLRKSSSETYKERQLGYKFTLCSLAAGSDKVEYKTIDLLLTYSHDSHPKVTKQSWIYASHQGKNLEELLHSVHPKYTPVKPLPSVFTATKKRASIGE